MKKAFSLAEILVTLTIIGVIASMTIPNLQTNAHKRELAAGCKKAFSTLSNAIALAEQANGPVRKWGLSDNSSAEDFEEYLLPYLNVIQVCKNQSGCFGEGKFYKADKSEYNEISDKGYGTPAVSFILADGTNASYDYAGDGSTNTKTFGVNAAKPIMVFAVDVNGTKNPNTLGQDVFFFVNTRDGLKPAGADAATGEINCGRGKDGSECAALVIKYGDLDYDKHLAEEAAAGGSEGDSDGGESSGEQDKDKGQSQGTK